MEKEAEKDLIRLLEMTQGVSLAQNHPLCELLYELNEKYRKGKWKIVDLIKQREKRVKIVNEIIKEISSRGRKFFSNEGKIAEIVDRDGEVLYKAEWGKKEFISLKKPSPDGWFHGGSLLSLVKEFRDFINSGVVREQSQLYSPYWGYPEEDMKAIRELAIKLGFIL